MAKKPTQASMGTNARAILSDWTALSTIVEQHSSTVKQQLEQSEEQREPKESFSILSQEQIDIALAGPYTQFLQQKISAYALLSRTKMEHTIVDKDLFKEKRDPDLEKLIPTDSLAKISSDELQKIREQLDELTKTHHQQWEAVLEQWKNTVIAQCEQCDFQLADTEKREFFDADPITTLQDRFTQLQLEEPKYKGDLNFSTYLLYKATIALHSSLSRRHLPHQQMDIKKALKNLKPIFDAINKEEKQVLHNQHTETEALLQPLQFAKSAL